MVECRIGLCRLQLERIRRVSISNRLGKDLFEVCKEKSLRKKTEEREKKQKEEKTYLELKEKADAILASGKEINKMSNKDLSIVLKSLKQNGDKRLPTKKIDMMKLYQEWKDRPPLVFDYGDELVNDEHEDDTENDSERDNPCIDNVTML